MKHLYIRSQQTVTDPLQQERLRRALTIILEHQVAYPRLADILSGPLPSHLRRLTQRVMSPPNRFSTPRLPRLTCL